MQAIKIDSSGSVGKTNCTGTIQTDTTSEVAKPINADRLNQEVATIPLAHTVPSLVRAHITSSERGFSIPLSENIKFLGNLLGEVIREDPNTGLDTFSIVEDLRQIAKEIRRNPHLDKSKEIKGIVQKLDINTLTKILRAFTIYFHLVNEAEKNEIIRVNRERELLATPDNPRKESINEAIYLLHQRGMKASDVQMLLDKLEIQPVFTKHPTEVKRPELIAALNNISSLVKRKEEDKLTEREKKKLERDLKEQITLIWKMNELRSTRPTVVEEAKETLYYLTEVVFPMVPKLHDDLRYALNLYYPGHTFDIKPFIKFASWVGGDRDGNQNATPEVTKEVAQMNSARLLEKYIEAVKKLKLKLSLSQEATSELTSSIEEDKTQIKISQREIELYKNEPYRLKLIFIQKRLENTLRILNSSAVPLGIKSHYKNSDEFLCDLLLISDSLQKNSTSLLADDSSMLADLILQVQTFGFHLAELDVRQHSKEHKKAVSEVLSKSGLLSTPYEDLSEEEKNLVLTQLISYNFRLVSQDTELSSETKKVLESFNAICEMQKKISKEAIRCHPISFTHDVSNALEVLLLAKEAGLVNASGESESFKMTGDIDIVPLFETGNDLRNAGQLLRKLFANPAYKAYLQSRGNFQEIMLGYSDSNKDVGYLSANIELHIAPKVIAEACREHNIKWRIFQGSGDSISRGGGQSGRGIQALPIGTVNGKIRFTEQGEKLSKRYSQISLAHRHLEAIIHSVLLASSREENSLQETEKDWLELAGRLSEVACETYQDLVYQDKDFWSFYTQATPVKFISQLLIASRPASREGLTSVEPLRAIPWVTSWTQTRMIVPSYYGVGRALSKVCEEKNGLECLQRMYREWLFFKTMIDNCQLDLARADMVTAKQYIDLVEPQELGQRIFAKITSEFDLTHEMLLAETNQSKILENAPVVRESIGLRNPYADVLNHIQVELLRRHKQADESKKGEFIPPILLSLGGVAAAMQGTG